MVKITLPFLMAFAEIILIMIDYRKSPGQEKIYINNTQKICTPMYNSKKDSDFKMWASGCKEFCFPLLQKHPWKKEVKMEIEFLALVLMCHVILILSGYYQICFLPFSFNTLLFSARTKVAQRWSMTYSTGTWTNCQNTLFKYKDKK